MASPIQTCHSLLFFLLLSSLSFISVSRAVVVRSLDLSFMFDWDTPGEPLPIPVSEQCETLHITWGRRSTTGPNPVAPYFLHVYSSNSTVPFIIPAGDQLQFDWQVPFIPGTLYQVCMFDINGNTGGCQATYTVIPSSSDIVNCSSIPPPPKLNVDAKVENGPFSRFGFIDQCTDISLTPTNGVPPYIMTVAPALHPPFNLTSKDMKPLNWTVSLSWASPFFISMADSVGNAWAAGPLHSGGPGQTTACLTDPNDRSKGTHHKTDIASIIGALFAGLLSGVLCTWVLLALIKKRREAIKMRLPDGYGFHQNPESPTQMIQSNPAELSRIESFRHVNGDTSQPIGPSDAQHRQGAVYVVHRDNGIAPVTVFLDDGEQVVELPPGYIDAPAPAGAPGPTSSPALITGGPRPSNKNRTTQQARQSTQPQLSRRQAPAPPMMPGRRPGLPERPDISRTSSLNSSISVSSDPFSTRVEASSSAV